jgi:hypothetical protein
VRTILPVVILSLAALACKNEPYQDLPMGVTNLINRATNVSNTYRYREQKLYSFLSITGADTIAYMRFHYAGDDLQSIVTDSTRTSLKLTSFYRSAEGVIDSTFLNDSKGHQLVSVRTVVYGGDGNPVSVRLKTWSGDVVKDQRAELTWADGNVVRLATFDTGVETPLRDLAITHDDHFVCSLKTTIICSHFR